MPQGMAAAGEGCCLLGEREDAGMGGGTRLETLQPLKSVFLGVRDTCSCSALVQEPQLQNLGGEKVVWGSICATMTWRTK